MSLPSLPLGDAYAVHIHTSSGSVGPLSRRDIQEKLKSSQLSATDVFWFDGMTDWKRLADHPELTEGLDLPAPPSGPRSDDELDLVFGGLVKESWRYYNQHAFASQIDEVFLGAIITSTLDIQYSLIDLSSDGTHHYLRFENLTDHSRIIVRLTHLTGDVYRSAVEGHRASVVIGYGERIADFSKIWSALKAEFKSGYLQSAEPGTMTVDGDMNTGYIYVQVDLYLKVDDYVQRDYTVRYDTLKLHMDATTNALKKYLHGRFGK